MSKLSNILFDSHLLKKYVSALSKAVERAGGASEEIDEASTDIMDDVENFESLCLNIAKIINSLIAHQECENLNDFQEDLVRSISAFSDLSIVFEGINDLNRAVIRELGNLHRLKQERLYLNMGLALAIEININATLGSFTYDLHERQIFNLEKFNQLCFLIENQSQFDHKMLAGIFKIYALLSRFIAHHYDSNDLYFIRNIADLGESLPLTLSLDKLQHSIECFSNKANKTETL